MSAILQRFHQAANDALVNLSEHCPRGSKLVLAICTPGKPEMDIVLEDQGLDTNEVLSVLRRRGLSIDGDNAYKRDLCDSIVGAMAFGAQNVNPPANHWDQRFWDIGREERAQTEELVEVLKGVQKRCEAMGLLWQNVNLESKSASIRQIIADGAPVERIKTKQQRVILLNDRALHALKKARRLADLRSIASKPGFPVSTYVFQPSKGGMWIQSPSVTIKHFKSALAALEIRERRQYDTRHTYATMCLMAGMNPAFIANQLGHSVEMLLSTYAKWISSASDWNELNKLTTKYELAQNWPNESAGP